eukprot:4608450-Pleurochrysis_carterae.AAC.1
MVESANCRLCIELAPRHVSSAARHRPPISCVDRRLYKARSERARVALSLTAPFAAHDRRRRSVSCPLDSQSA